MPISKSPMRVVVGDDGKVQIAIDGPHETPEQRIERKAHSARCGHVKRLLSRGERLTGDLLTFVLAMGVDDDIARKLQAGEKLSDYERHLMLDVYLLHARMRGS